MRRGPDRALRRRRRRVPRDSVVILPSTSCRSVCTCQREQVTNLGLGGQQLERVAVAGTAEPGPRRAGRRGGLRPGEHVQHGQPGLHPGTVQVDPVLCGDSGRHIPRAGRPPRRSRRERRVSISMNDIDALIGAPRGVWGRPPRTECGSPPGCAAAGTRAGWSSCSATRWRASAACCCCRSARPPAPRRTTTCPSRCARDDRQPGGWVQVQRLGRADAAEPGDGDRPEMRPDGRGRGVGHRRPCRRAVTLQRLGRAPSPSRAASTRYFASSGRSGSADARSSTASTSGSSVSPAIR